jgi:flagellin-like protein
MEDRAQSEVVGVILLTGVVVVLVSVVGAIVISGQQTDRGPTADIIATTDGNDLILKHAGGGRMAVADIDVYIADGTTTRYDLTAFTEQVGDGDGRFDPGERRQLTLSQRGRLRILVVAHSGETGRVLLKEFVEL